MPAFRGRTYLFCFLFLKYEIMDFVSIQYTSVNCNTVLCDVHTILTLANGIPSSIAPVSF